MSTLGKNAFGPQSSCRPPDGASLRSLFLVLFRLLYKAVRAVSGSGDKKLQNIWASSFQFPVCHLSQCSGRRNGYHVACAVFGINYLVFLRKSGGLRSKWPQANGGCPATTAASSPRGCCIFSVLPYLCRRVISAPSDHLSKTGQLTAPEPHMSQSTQAERR